MHPSRFDYHRLKDLVVLVMRKSGISDEDSRLVSDVLLASDLYGIESHGVQRLIMYMNGMEIGRINRNASMRIIKETPISAVIDADAGLGQPVSVRAMEMAIDKASKVGFGMVVVNNSNHYGIAGYYSMMAARRGFLGMSMTNTEGLVVPTYGRSPMLGTNPIAVTMPASPTYFHLDVSTSVVTAGKMEVYAKADKKLPDGWLVDTEGTVDTDPNTFLSIRKNKWDGGLLTLGGFGETYGGHKGYGLSMVVELMTGVLGLGHTSRHVREVPAVERCCHVFQAIDYGVFGDKAEIEKKMSDWLQEIRDSQKAAGCDRIYTHGEKEMESREKVLRDGVFVQDATYREILGICEKFDINPAEYLIAKS